MVAVQSSDQARVTTANANVHVSGTTFVIDGETIDGKATIADRVEIINGGKLLADAGEDFFLGGGVEIDSASKVKLGKLGTITVSTGSVESSIVATSTELQARSVIVESGAKLSARGKVLSTLGGPDTDHLQLAGVLSIGERSGVKDSLELKAWLGDPATGVLEWGAALVVNGPSSQLEFDLFDDAGQANSDTLVLGSAFLNGDDGQQTAPTIALSTAIADVLSLEYGDTTTLIELTTNTIVSGTSPEIDGVFDQIEYADATMADFLDPDDDSGTLDGKLVAVVYEEQFESGEPLENSIIGSCNGVCAVIALPGDFNLDGTVDISDQSVLSPNFNTIGGMTWADGDANGDGNVDISDASLLTQYFGMSANYGGTASSLASAPEPASLLLLAFGLAAVLVRRRR